MRSPFLSASLALAILCALALSLAARTSRADSPFDGKWKQGPLREDYTVQQWLPGCGPAPVSGTQGGGEVVSVHQEGDELTFAGGGRVYRTNQCYDQLPTLARDAHSREASGRAWRTRCTTPPADPRRAMMQTLVVAANDSHIDVTETGRYEISLAEGRCIADVKRTRSFDIVTREGAVAPAPTPTPTPEPPPAPPPQPPAPPPPRANACASPGEPARLEVRPSRKLLRTGESFTFHAVVTDANGCATGTSTVWSLAPGNATTITVDPSGKVTIPADAPEGSVAIVASAAGKSARVMVDVTAPAHYDDLLARSGLNAAGENDNASVAEIATGSIGGGADTRAEEAAHKRRMIFIGVVGALVVALGVIAIVYSRKAKRAAALEAEAEREHAERVRAVQERNREKAAAHAAQVRAHQESVQARAARKIESAGQAAAPRAAGEGAAATRAGDGTMVCPACRREYPATSSFCPQDASRLVPLNGNEDSAPAGGICPACKRGFDPGVKVCPFDHEELIPYAMHAAARAPAGQVVVPSKGKICPTCGGRFDGSATFCGKDGTALVLLN